MPLTHHTPYESDLQIELLKSLQPAGKFLSASFKLGLYCRYATVICLQHRQAPLFKSANVTHEFKMLLFILLVLQLFRLKMEVGPKLYMACKCP